MNGTHTTIINVDKTDLQIETRLKNACYMLGCGITNSLTSEIRPQDFDSLRWASRWSMQVRLILGMLEVVTVEVMKDSRSKVIVDGKTVMIRTMTYTPNNRGCTAVGSIIFNQTFDTVEDVLAFYSTRWQLMQETL